VARSFAKTALRLRKSAATSPSLSRLQASPLLLCLVFVAPSVTAVSGVARAEGEDAAALEKVTKLNKKAVDEYQNLNFEESRKALRAALEVCAQSGLENHPVTARTYIHLGIVTFTGFKQREDAVDQFRKALKIQGDIKLDKILATPEVQEVFDEAVAAQKADSKPPAPEVKPGEGVEHTPVTRSPQGQTIVIKATVDPGLGAKKVLLSFSTDGAEDFEEREMKEDPPGSGFYVAEIPASGTQGAVVNYYIEAYGENDKLLGSKGTDQRTLKIAMTGPGGQPLGRPKKPPKDEPDEAPSFFLGIGVGGGVGWATGNGEVNSTNVVDPAGFAPSKLLHFSPEIGYFLSPELLLSVQFRFQLISGANEYHSSIATECGDGVCSPGTYAFAGLAKINYLFGEGDFRTFVSGIGGLGTIRHVAEFQSQMNCGSMGNETCLDTVPSGPVFVGAGAGVLYNVTPAFALTLGTNALLGFTKFTFHVDLNLGLAVMF
jgi:hypothetical protein